MIENWKTETKQALKNMIKTFLSNAIINLQSFYLNFTTHNNNL